MSNAPLAKLNHKITVIDAPCGSGKTTRAISNLSSNIQYLYITPLLSEVQRVTNDASVKFIQPQGSKKEDLKNLLSDGHNVVTTHACFSNLRANEANILSNVVLIIDEAIETRSSQTST